jgi:hypothetical protein
LQKGTAIEREEKQLTINLKKLFSYEHGGARSSTHHYFGGVAHQKTTEARLAMSPNNNEVGVLATGFGYYLGSCLALQRINAYAASAGGLGGGPVGTQLRLYPGRGWGGWLLHIEQP